MSGTPKLYRCMMDFSRDLGALDSYVYKRFEEILGEDGHKYASQYLTGLGDAEIILYAEITRLDDGSPLKAIFRLMIDEKAKRYA